VVGRSIFDQLCKSIGRTPSSQGILDIFSPSCNNRGRPLCIRQSGMVQRIVRPLGRCPPVGGRQPRAVRATRASGDYLGGCSCKAFVHIVLWLNVPARTAPCGTGRKGTARTGTCRNPPREVGSDLGGGYKRWGLTEPLGWHCPIAPARALEAIDAPACLPAKQPICFCQTACRVKTMPDVRSTPKKGEFAHEGARTTPRPERRRSP
jgi:hypothetical protein